MTDLLKIARQRIDEPRTHYEGCERDHRECLIQRLADEVERLRAAFDLVPSPPTQADIEWAGKAHLHDALQENERLRAELAAAQRDAFRYRFLRDHHLRSLWHPTGEAIGMDEVIPGDDPDSAIDAAMAREEKRDDSTRSV